MARRLRWNTGPRTQEVRIYYKDAAEDPWGALHDTVVGAEGEQTYDNTADSQHGRLWGVQPVRTDVTPNKIGRIFIVVEDLLAPSVVSATINDLGTTLTVVFDEAVVFGADGNTGFAISASGGAATLTYVGGAGTTTLVFSISRTIDTAETVTWAYTQPGDGAKDAIGNMVDTFAGEAVTNDSEQDVTPPDAVADLALAVYSGDTIRASWTPSVAADLVSEKLYRTLASPADVSEAEAGVLVASLTSPSGAQQEDSGGLDQNTNYYFAVVSEDDAGLKTLSNVASLAIVLPSVSEFDASAIETGTAGTHSARLQAGTFGLDVYFAEKMGGGTYLRLSTKHTHPAAADNVVNVGDEVSIFGSYEAGPIGTAIYAVLGEYADASTVVLHEESRSITEPAGDVTAPTVSSVVDTETGQTTATVDFSTDEANGDASIVVTTSPTPPTDVQVEAGQDHTGAAAAFATSQAVSTTGAQPTVNVTGLAASTTYYAHVVHRDAAGNPSSVVSGDGFTTDAAASWSFAGLIGAGFGTGGSTTTTSSISPTANRIIIAVQMMRWNGSTDTISISSGFATGGWTHAVRGERNAAANTTTDIWWAVTTASPGSGTVQTTLDSGERAGGMLRIYEIGGGDLADVIEQGQGAGSSASSLTVTLPVAPAANAFAFAGAVSENDADQFTADPDFSTAYSTVSGGEAVMVQYDDSAPDQAITWTGMNTVSNAGAMIEINAA